MSFIVRVRRVFSALVAALALSSCAAINPCPAGKACIPIIDAHSQADHKVDLDEILPLIDRAGIARVILGSRGRLDFRQLAAFARRHPERITASVRTKGRVYHENRDKYYRRLDAQLAMPEFGAMAELLIYHAAKNQRGAPEVAGGVVRFGFFDLLTTQSVHSLLKHPATRLAMIWRHAHQGQTADKWVVCQRLK